jgi:hypothetical protein
MQNNMSYDVGYHTGTGYTESKSIFGRIKDSLLDILTNEEPEQPISLFQLRERNDHPTTVSDQLPQAKAEIAYAPTAQVVYTVEDSAIPYQPITIPAQAQAQAQPSFSYQASNYQASQAPVSGMQRPQTPADFNMISSNRQQAPLGNQSVPPANPMADRFHRYLGQEEPIRSTREQVVPTAYSEQASLPNVKPTQGNPAAANPFNPFFQGPPGQRTESLFFGQTPPRR